MTGLAKKTSQFYDQIINANKTTNVSGLGAVTVGNPSFSHFTEVFGNNVNKRNIEVRDSLLNQKNFANYWKSREKHRDANIEPYKISYGIVTDQDGDGFAENVAFYTDSNGAQQILGYNEYVVTPPKMSDKKAKATYYQQTADERKKQSYPDFMYTRKDLLTDWMKPDAIEKYIEKVDKSLVGIVKAFFAQSAKDVYSKLTPKQKTAFANAFIKIAADAMIDNEANKAQAAIVKG